jgi:hypothetical protein
MIAIFIVAIICLCFFYVVFIAQYKSYYGFVSTLWANL